MLKNPRQTGAPLVVQHKKTQPHDRRSEVVVSVKLSALVVLTLFVPVQKSAGRKGKVLDEPFLPLCSLRATSLSLYFDCGPEGGVTNPKLNVCTHRLWFLTAEQRLAASCSRSQAKYVGKVKFANLCSCSCQQHHGQHHPPGTPLASVVFRSAGFPVETR